MPTIGVLLRSASTVPTSTMIAATPFQVPATGGVLFDGCHNFEEVPTNREQIVFKTEFPDPRVDIHRVYAQYRCEIIDHRGKFFGNQTDLT